MKGIASITYESGGTVLAARSPYEREVLLEYLSSVARHSAVVRLDLNGWRWSVAYDESSQRPACVNCRRAVHVFGIADSVARGPFCLPCLVGLPDAAIELRRGERRAAHRP